jgi:nucleotide sugar dehydrogenase
MIKVGIVGCGFVGSAVAAGFSLKADVKVYDKYRAGFNTLSEVCKQDIIFLCLPTPMRKSDGLPEMSYLRSALDDLKAEVTKIKSLIKKIIVIKSTVLPGTNRRLQAEYPEFIFISNPEFLTARAARLDFINAARVIIGGDDQEAKKKVFALYSTITAHAPIYMCSWEEAEMVKYMCNCYFALKVSFLNEMFILAAKTGVSFENLKLMWIADGRIGNSHTDVPGHDGDFGFGGTCFPKDLSAFVHWARGAGYPCATLEAAHNVNQKVRVRKDWQIFDDQEAEHATNQ